MTDATTTMDQLRTVPRERGWPLLGQSFRLLRDGGDYFNDLQKRHGPVVGLSLFGFKVTSLMGPEANKLVFQNKGDLFKSSQWELLIGPFFHRGLMLLDGSEHRMHRRIMQTAFTKDALRDYFGAMQPRIGQELDAWQVEDNFLIFDHLKSMTLNIGSDVFVGHTPGTQAAEMNRAFLDTVRAATGIVRANLPGTRWRKGIKGRAFLERFFRREIAAKRAQPGTDLFSRLCTARSEDDELFSDDDVINHMIFTLMAAHDTTTITVSNMVYQLARHPEWQTRLRAQSQALCDSKGTSTLDYDDLASLTDIERVMKEALRLCAPVPYMPRKLTRTIEFEGYHLPAGSFVSISPWISHYLSDYWREPHRFDPERFGPERAEHKQHPFLWAPFGGGAHKCIGLHFGEMEIKAIMHQLLLRFRWSVPADYQMQQDFTSLPIPKDHLPVKLEVLPERPV